METVILIPANKPDESLVPYVSELITSYDVVVSDDGSGSGYDRIFKRLENICRVIRSEKSKGRGAALKAGFAYIRSSMPDCKYIITADSDIQYKISDINKVGERLKRESSGIVTGARRFENKMPGRLRLQKTAFRLLTGVKLTDTEPSLCGFRTADCEWLGGVGVGSRGYETGALMTAAGDKIPIHEEYIDTVYEREKSGAFVHSIAVYKAIFFSSTALKYAISSMVCFVLDFVLMLIISKMPSVASMSDKLNAAIATFSAWIISSFTNFNINRSFVFKKKDEYLKSMIGYYSLAGVVYLIKLGLIELVIKFLGLKLWITKIIVETVMFVFTYFVQHNVIFKKKKTKTK